MTENDFENDTNELLANSVFGRSIQNKRNEKDLHIVANKNLRNKHVSSIHYEMHTNNTFLRN